jgi:hypothetical protein
VLPGAHVGTGSAVTGPGMSRAHGDVRHDQVMQSGQDARDGLNLGSDAGSGVLRIELA